MFSDWLILAEPGTASLSVEQVTTSSITVSVSSQTGAEYKIYYSDVTEGSSEQMITTSSSTYSIDNLEPGHKYDMSIVVRVNGVDRDRSDVTRDCTRMYSWTIG